MFTRAGPLDAARSVLQLRPKIGAFGAQLRALGFRVAKVLGELQQQPAQQAAPLPNAAPLPLGFTRLWEQAATAGKEGRKGDFTYRYAVEGSRAAAIMTPRSIPRDDAILLATIDDLFRRAFHISTGNMTTPRFEAGNGIVFESRVSRFTVLVIRSETREGFYGPGEPHTLLAWHRRIR